LNGWWKISSSVISNQINSNNTDFVLNTSDQSLSCLLGNNYIRINPDLSIGSNFNAIGNYLFQSELFCLNSSFICQSHNLNNNLNNSLFDFYSTGNYGLSFGKTSYTQNVFFNDTNTKYFRTITGICESDYHSSYSYFNYPIAFGICIRQNTVNQPYTDYKAEIFVLTTAPNIQNAKTVCEINLPSFNCRGVFNTFLNNTDTTFLVFDWNSHLSLIDRNGNVIRSFNYSFNTIKQIGKNTYLQDKSNNQILKTTDGLNFTNVYQNLPFNGGAEFVPVNDSIFISTSNNIPATISVLNVNSRLANTYTVFKTYYNFNTYCSTVFAGKIIIFTSLGIFAKNL
jgi:hypothetical protein